MESNEPWLGSLGLYTPVEITRSAQRSLGQWAPNMDLQMRNLLCLQQLSQVEPIFRNTVIFREASQLCTELRDLSLLQLLDWHYYNLFTRTRPIATGYTTWSIISAVGLNLEGCLARLSTLWLAADVRNSLLFLLPTHCRNLKNHVSKWSEQHS
jgi:hypothetical protein